MDYVVLCYSEPLDITDNSRPVSVVCLEIDDCSRDFELYFEHVLLFEAEQTLSVIRYSEQYMATIIEWKITRGDWA